MATKHTLTGNIFDLAGATFGSKAVSLHVVTNLGQGALVDKTTNAIHLGGKVADVNESTGEFTVDLIDTSATDLNVPAGEAQYEVRATYIDAGTRQRQTWYSGWFGLTADANLADITTDVSPLAVSSASTYALEAKAYRDEAEVITGLTGEDDAVALLVNTPGSDTASALSATIATAAKGSNVSRFIKRAQAGESLKLVAIGDSVLEGTTVTNPATDGTMALLDTDLTARFGGTFTVANHAVSGYTTGTAYTSGKVAAAVAEQGDLYIIGFGKNDTGWDREPVGEQPVPGYPTQASIDLMEQMVRTIRVRVPHADIILMAENPYTPLASTANTVLQAYNTKMRDLAAAYAVEFVDAYTPFAESATPLATLVPDGTHPGDAGHRLMADTILAHLPATYPGAAVAPAAVDPTRTRTGATQKINTSGSLLGWTKRTTTGTSGSGTWAHTGAGWAGTAPYATSTAGDYAEFTFTGTDLLVTISTLAADNAVVTVTVDGAPTYTARNLTQGKQGAAYPVPFATGLSNAQHTVRIALVSGTLKIHEAAWTEGGTGHAASSVVVDLGSGTTETAVDTGGAITYVLNNAAAIPLPTGWGSMDVVITGYVNFVVKATTTTDRLIQSNLRTDLVLKQTYQKTIPPRSAGEHIEAFTISHAEANKTATVGVRFELRLQSTDKTNTFYRSWGLQAVCHRRT